MPGEEGYPAYLSARVAEFYERAGRVKCLGGDDREGALSVIGAVSPPGGDLSDPVVQATLRVVKVFWSLEDHLAYKRHFPAISWLNSYSLYYDNLDPWLTENVASDWVDLRSEAMRILQEEADLAEIVNLVGVESLSAGDRLTLEVARSIREDFLHQNAFHEVDTYTSLEKQYEMLKLVLHFGEAAREALQKGVAITDIETMAVRERIARAKYEPEDRLDTVRAIKDEIDKEIETLVGATVE
jgi:V/A-type H+-transporting ATPase subunit A